MTRVRHISILHAGCGDGLAVSASMAPRYPASTAPVVFRTKPQSHEDVAPAARRLSLATVRPAAPLMEERACRPKPSLWLCGFVRNKKRGTEGQVRPWTLKQRGHRRSQGDENGKVVRLSHPPPFVTPDLIRGPFKPAPDQWIPDQVRDDDEIELRSPRSSTLSARRRSRSGRSIRSAATCCRRCGC